MLLNFLGRGNSVKVRRLANHLLNKQNPDGGWPIYDNGPSDVSATVKAYWALKFAGPLPARAAHGGRAQAHQGARRHPQGQHLHQILSGPVRPIRLARRAHDPAGDHAVPEVVLLQSLRDVGLDPRHRRAPCPSSGPTSRRSLAPRTRRSTSCSPIRAATFPSNEAVGPHALALLEDLFPACGTSWLEGHGRPRRPLDPRLVPALGRGLDPRAPAGLRRPGRHLSRASSTRSWP